MYYKMDFVIPINIESRLFAFDGFSLEFKQPILFILCCLQHGGIFGKEVMATIAYPV